MSQNFVNYSNASAIVEKIALKLSALNGAYVIKGNSTFANLPATPTESQNGYVYNVTDAFTTDARFVEGAGKKYEAGTNVVIVDLSTFDAVTPQAGDNPKTEGWYELVNGKYVATEDETVDSGKTYYEKNVSVKYDVIGSFVDVDELEAAIKAVQDMIDDEFDAKSNYAAGAIVIHDAKLYKLDAAYTAYTAVEPVGTENPKDEGWYELDGTSYVLTTDTTVDNTKTYYELHSWDDVTATQTTVIELIDSAEPDPLTTEQMNTLLGMLD